jgi:type III secretion protein C
MLLAMGHRMLRTGLVLAVLLASAAIARAQPVTPGDQSHSDLPGADRLYPLHARDLDVKDALRLFAKNLRIGLIVDDAITGPITEDLPKGMTHLAYIDELASIFDFVWYFDGSVLRVSPVGAMEMDILALRDNSGAAVIDVLHRLGIHQAKFMHRSDPRSRTLMVAGPKSYLETVRKAVEAIEEADRTNITLLRGNEGGVPGALGILQDIEGAAPATAPPTAGN